MTLTCAFSPLAIHARANGCWRVWHFRNRHLAELALQSIRYSEDCHLEVKPVSNIHRKHPVSIAVSMALLAAAATSAMASERAGAPAENAEQQGPAQQDAPMTSSPDAKEVDDSTVTVYGVRQSQIRAIEAKRLAPSIQDCISAESIGQLPDVTITDALQRITGVQINRDAGVGTSVDVRGLPQVGT